MTTIGTGGAAPGSEEDEIRALAQEAEDRELAQEEDRALALLGLLITQVEPRGEKAGVRMLGPPPHRPDRAA
jgi:hypothetical protein